MKNSIKLFALALVASTFFSCTTDEYDAALEQSVKVTENIQNTQFKEGDEDNQNSSTSEGTPLVVIVKKD